MSQQCETTNPPAPIDRRDMDAVLREYGPGDGSSRSTELRLRLAALRTRVRQAAFQPSGLPFAPKSVRDLVARPFRANEENDYADR